MIQAHPEHNILQAFTLGQLDDLQMAMVTVHLSYCSACKKQHAQMESIEADKCFADATDIAQQPEFDVKAMLDTITASDDIVAAEINTSIKMEFQNKEFEIPKVLAGIVARAGHWQSVIGNLWQKSVTNHGLGYQIDFIYMEAGGSTPKHTHRGTEYTLVLDGCFSDASGDYHPGDLIVRNNQDEHTPWSDTGCLCLAAIDAPLHFTSGLARLINPFSNLFFKSEANKVF